MMEETTKKSRINLMVISVIISIYYVANIKISGFSLFGLTVESGNPSSIIYFVWIAWGYLFLRYITYYIKDGLDKTLVVIRLSIANIEAMNQLKIVKSEAVGRDEKWKNTKIHLKSVDVVRFYRGMITFKFSGGLSGTGGLAVDRELEHTSHPLNRSMLINIKAFFRSLIIHPEILEYIAPMVIGCVPVIIYSIELL